MVSSTKNSIRIIEYPFGDAAGKPNTADSGKVMQAILEKPLKDLGLIEEWITVETPKIKVQETYLEGKIRNFSAVKSAVNTLANCIATALWNDKKPLILGGDHSQGTATVKATLLVDVLRGIRDGRVDIDQNIGTEIINLANRSEFEEAARIIQKHYDENHNTKESIDKIVNKNAVVWLDSHGDYNTPEISGSGNFHGMSLKVVTKDSNIEGFSDLFGTFTSVSPNNIYVVGHRDLDPIEIDHMKKDGINFMPYSLVADYGSASETKFNVKIKSVGNKNNNNLSSFSDVVKEIETEISNRGLNQITSHDIDVAHGKFTSATGTPQGLIEGSKLPLSEEIITKEMIRPNANDASPSGPSPSAVRDAVKSVVNRKGVADLTEVSAYIRVETEEGKKYIVDTASLVTGMQALVAMIAPESESIRGIKPNRTAQEVSLLKEVANEIEKNFPDYNFFTENGNKKFDIKKLVTDLISPAIESRSK
jgi:arginase family enzyme